MSRWRKTMSKVYTEDTCGRCGKTERREGATIDMPLVGWSSLQLLRRDDGAGWAGATMLVKMHVCPDCAEKVKRFVEEDNG